MRKVFKMEELDCAVCAQKMEDGIKKLEGVENANVNFLSQKRVLTLDDGVELERLMDEVARVCKKVDPDCKVLF